MGVWCRGWFLEAEFSTKGRRHNKKKNNIFEFPNFLKNAAPPSKIKKKIIFRIFGHWLTPWKKHLKCIFALKKTYQGQTKWYYSSIWDGVWEVLLLRHFLKIETPLGLQNSQIEISTPSPLWGFPQIFFFSFLLVLHLS